MARELTQEDYNAQKKALREYAEKVRELYLWCATNEQHAIAHCMTEPYRTMQKAFKRAIALAYIALDADDVERVYEIFVDCNESVAYCVETYARDKIERMSETRTEVLGLPELTEQDRKDLMAHFMH